MSLYNQRLFAATRYVALVILLLAFIEIALRIAGGEPEYPLIDSLRVSGELRYRIHPRIGERFVELPDSLIPAAPPVTFRLPKEENTLRLVALGGLSTRGFPYEVNAGYPFQLQFRLRNALLDNWVEVLNLGYPWLTVSRMQKLLPEILSLQPDLILIQPGEPDLLLSEPEALPWYHPRRWGRALSRLQLVRRMDAMLFSPERDSLPPVHFPKYFRSVLLCRDSLPELTPEELSRRLHRMENQLVQVVSAARRDSVLVLLATLPRPTPCRNTSRHAIVNRLNDLIRRVGRQTDVPVVEVEAAFAAARRAGWADSRLFYPTGLLTFDGHRLLAQTLYQALYAIQFNHPLEPVVYRDTLLTIEQLQQVVEDFPRDSAAVTPLDLEIGNLRHFLFAGGKRYALTPGELVGYIPVENALTRDLAFRHLKGELGWEYAHYRLAEHYARQKRYRRVLREYRAVNLSFYELYLPHLLIGDLYTVQGNYPEALWWYENARQRAPENPRVLAKLGNALTLAHRFAQAIAPLEQALAADQRQPVFAPPMRATLYYLLAVSYANLKQFQSAEAALKNALRAQPGFPAALELQQKIREFRERR